MRLKMKHIHNYSARFYVEFLALACITCMICPCESTLVLSSEQKKDGSWILTEGEYVTLKCTMSSYTNTLTWRYASSEAGKCTSLDCNSLLTGDGTFTFTYDITNKVFLWSLGPVRMEHDGKLFECFDGTNTQSVTAKVTAAPNPTERLAIAGLVIACIALSIAVVVLIMVICYVRRKLRNLERDVESFLPRERPRSQR